MRAMWQVMNDWLTSNYAGLLALIALWSLLTGAIWKLFERIEKTAAPEAREAATRFVMSVGGGTPLRGVARTFNHAFDAVFGKRHLSWRCFMRSCAASSAMTILFTLLFLPSYDPELADNGGFIFDLSAPTYDAADRAWTVLLSVLINWMPDYFSLLKSRWILARMESATPRKFVCLFFGDLVLTVCIACVVVNVAAFFLIAVQEYGFMPAVRDLPNLITYAPTITLFGVFPQPTFLGWELLGVFFYTTFMTSIWSLLYASAALLLRVAPKVDGGVHFLQWFLDIRKQPFLSIGVVLILVITALFVPIAIVRLM